MFCRVIITIAEQTELSDRIFYLINSRIDDICVREVLSAAYFTRRDV